MSRPLVTVVDGAQRLVELARKFPRLSGGATSCAIAPAKVPGRDFLFPDEDR